MGPVLTTTLLPSGPRFNQLLMYNPREPKEVIGDLAQSWEIKDGGKNFLFRLHDANWHDGTPVTAEDIVWSLNRMAQPDVTRGRVTAIRSFYEYQTAVAVDDQTVLMPLKFPSATALGWLAVDYYKMYPKALGERELRTTSTAVSRTRSAPVPGSSGPGRKATPTSSTATTITSRTPCPMLTA